MDRGDYTGIELAVGTIDEEFLVGERDGEDKPLGAFGLALVNPEGEHYYLRNEIKGVTDASQGTWFWKMSKEAKGAKDE